MASKAVSSPIFHHYVPKFMLKEFAVRRKKQHYVRVFDKHIRRTFTANINDVMGQNHFNSVTIGEFTVCAEQVTAWLDGRAAPILKSIIRHNSLSHLTEEDEDTILYFMALQINRGTAARNSHDDIITQFKARLIKSVGEENLPPEVTGMATPEQKKLLNISTLFASLHDIVSVLRTRNLVLLRTMTGGKLLLGDNPITLYNSMPNDAMWSNLGLACEGIQIHMPLSPELAIALWCPTLLKEFQTAIEAVRGTHAKLQAMELLAAPHMRVAIQAETRKVEDKLRQCEATVDAATRKSAIPMTDDNTLHQNSLQIAYAEQYIISATGEFFPVQQMLDADPSFKVGRRMRVS